VVKAQVVLVLAAAPRAEPLVALLAAQLPGLLQVVLPRAEQQPAVLLRVRQEQLLGLLVRLLEQLEPRLEQLGLQQEPLVPPPQVRLVPLQQHLVLLLLPQLLLQQWR
jgi:hypothetical protein